MRKKLLFAVVMMLNFSAFAQLEINSVGDVGIGNAPIGTYKLTLKRTGNCEIDFVNGNGHEFVLGNYTTSLWNAPNVFSLWDKTRDKSLFEFRAEEAFIHDRLVIGKGYIGNKPTLELDDQKFMMFTSNTTNSGILFKEVYDYTNNSVRYGAKIEYDEDCDMLNLGTYQDWIFKDAISIYRPYGNVGFGGRYTGSTYKMYVYGRAFCTYGSWEASDKRFKEDIQGVSAEAMKLKKLNGVSYKKKDINRMLNFQLGDSVGFVNDMASFDTIVYDKKDSVVSEKAVIPERSYGFIAQEVREIYPDLVIEDENGYLAVNYTGFIPIIVESIKEQQLVIEQQKAEIVDLNKRIEELAKEIQKISSVYK